MTAPARVAGEPGPAPALDRHVAIATRSWTRREASARLLRFGRPVLAPLAISLVARVAGMGLGIALLGVGAWGVGRVAADPSTAIAPVLWAMVAISLAKGLLRYLEQFAGHWVAFKALAMMRVDFYDHLAPQSPAGVLSRRTGDLLARATKDVDRVEVFFAHTLVPVLAAVMVPAGVLAWLAVAVDPVLAVVLAPFLALVGLVVPMWGRRASEQGAATARRARGQTAQLVAESMQGVREILAFGAAARRREQAAAISREVHEGLDVLAEWTARRRAVNTALVLLGTAAVAVTGTARLGSGALEWAGLAVAVVVSLAAFTPLLAVEDVAPDLEQAFASARRIWEVTDAPPQTLSPADPTPVPPGPLDVVFEDVSFGYPSSPALVLEDASFTVPAGARVGIVGSSGTGKSTIIQLLTRGWDPQVGRILVGGVDVRDLALEDLRAHVAEVSQRTYLFNDTIAANVRLARPSATDEELVAACGRAALHETILAMPQGYDTRVGEMGERLSGGQRQRVAIARALLADAPILVLDEATSQLDVTTEAQIQDTLADVARGRTVIVIAHRPAAVRGVDALLRVDGGRVTPV